MKAILAALHSLSVAMIAAPASGASAPSPARENSAHVADASLSFKAADGKQHTPLEKRGQKATVFLFLMHDCPVANAMAPEIGRIAGDYSARGITFYRVYVSESAREVNTHARETGLQFPGLLDPGLRLARAVGATRVPEAAVVSPTGTLLYRGRIDDRAVKAGVVRPTAREQDLRRALDAILAGKAPEKRFTPAVGCYLPSR